MRQKMPKNDCMRLKVYKSTLCTGRKKFFLIWRSPYGSDLNPPNAVSP